MRDDTRLSHTGPLGSGLKGELAIARDESERVSICYGARWRPSTLKLNILLTDFMGALGGGAAQEWPIRGGPLYDQSGHRARDR